MFSFNQPNRGFGSPATGQQGGTGFGFGAGGGTTTAFGQTPAPAPAFGPPTTGFGATQGTSTPGFGTASTGTGTTGFGTGAKFGGTPTGTTGFGGFGTSTGGTGFGSGGFGGGTTGTGFGTQAAGTNTGGGFGASPGTPLFGSPSATPAFGSAGPTAASTGTSPFGTTGTTGGFGSTTFGVQPTTGFSTTPQGGAFGPGPAATPFGSATGFNAAPAQTSPFGGGSTWGAGALGPRAAQPGTGNPPYKPTVQTDTNGTSHVQAITAMDPYKEKSFEELRWEDYQRGNNKGTGQTASPLGGGFGLGGTPGFGTGASAFSSAATPSTNTGFGFGTSTTMGGGTTTGLGTGFGGFGTGTMTSTGNTGFGTTGLSGGFGSTASTFGNTQNKPAFGTAPTFGTGTTPSFGGATGGSLFGQQASGGGGFGTTGSAFGTAQTGFGGTPAPAPAPSPFGSTTTPTLGTSTFGTGTAGLGAGAFGANTGTGGFGTGAFSVNKPATTGFGTTGFGASTTGSAFGSPAAQQKPFGTTGFGTPGAGTTGAFGTPTTSLFQTPQTNSFGGFPKPATAGTGTSGFTTGFGTGTTGFGGGLGVGFSPTPAFGTQAPATPNFALGGNSMQAALQQPQTGTPSLFQSSFGTPAQQPQTGSFSFSTPGFGGQMGSPAMATTPGSMGATDVQKPLFIRVGSSGKKSMPGRRRSDSADETPPALQSYRFTPRSAAKITPRGMRQAQLGQSAGSARDEDEYADVVSPGIDSFAVRSHKNLDLSLGGEDIFAAESKIFERDDMGEDAFFLDGGVQDAIPTGGENFNRLAGRSPPQQQPLASVSATTWAPTASASRTTSYAHALAEGVAETKGVPPREDGQSDPMTPVSGSPPKLTKDGYSTKPSLETLEHKDRSELRRVTDFTVVRKDYGEIKWDGETDVEGLDLDALVNIESKEVYVYCEEQQGGEKVNKPALVTLYHVTSRKKGPEEFKRYLMEVVSRWDGAEFVSYDGLSGRWQFRVAHFSKYGLEDEDEDDEGNGKLETTPGSGKAGPPQEAARSQRSVKGAGGRPSYGAPESDEDNTDHDEADDEHVDVSKDPTAEGDQPTLQEHYGIPPERVKALFIDFGGDNDQWDTRNDRLEDVEMSTAGRAVLPRHMRPASSGAFGEVDSMGVGVADEEQLQEIMDVDNGERDDAVPYEPKATPIPSELGRRLSRDRGSLLPSNPLHLRRQGPFVLAAPVVRAEVSVSGKRQPVDYATFMGGSFRAGWGPGGSLAQLILPVTSNSLACGGVRVAVRNTITQNESLDRITAPLEVHLSASKPIGDDVDRVAPTWSLPGPIPMSRSPLQDYLMLIGEVVHRLMLLDEGEGTSQHPHRVKARRLWSLVNALWGQERCGPPARPLPVRGGPWDSLRRSLFKHYHCAGDWTLNDFDRRRQMVSLWLKEAVRGEPRSPRASPDEDENLANILQLLQSHRLREAAQVAADAGFLRLSILIAAVGDRNGQNDVSEQLRTLEKVSEGRLRSPALVRIYQLLSGRDGPSQHAGLDWARSLGLYLWYDLKEPQEQGHGGIGAAPTDGEEAVVRAVTKFGNGAYVVPRPHWQSPGTGADLGVPTVLYSLLDLYRDDYREGVVREVVDHRGITSDPSDFLQLWLLMTVLDALGVGPGSRKDHALRVHVTSSLVFQLTALGLWEWAVYILQQLKPEHINPSVRSRLVKDLVFRHGGWDVGEPTNLLTTLKVPTEWVEEARATALRYGGWLYVLGSTRGHVLPHSMSAKDWSLSHDIVLNVAAPLLLLQERTSELAALLENLELHSDEVNSWERRGSHLLDWLRLQQVRWGSPLSETMEVVRKVRSGLNAGALRWGASDMTRDEIKLHPQQEGSPEEDDDAVLKAAECAVASALATRGGSLQRMQAEHGVQGLISETELQLTNESDVPTETRVLGLCRSIATHVRLVDAL